MIDPFAEEVCPKIAEFQFSTHINFYFQLYPILVDIIYIIINSTSFILYL
jgi:hypothetical protein